MEENFYQYQRRRLLILLVWGVGNVLGGIGSLLSKNKFWRQFWLQAFSWGAIDALLAVGALRSQTKKLETYPASASDQKVLPASVQKDIKSYHRILLINTFLDVGYLISGEFLRRWGKQNGRADRQGIGVGFIVQGLFLFIYDLLLTLETNRNWLSKIK